LQVSCLTHITEYSLWPFFRLQFPALFLLLLFKCNFNQIAAILYIFQLQRASTAGRGQHLDVGFLLLLLLPRHAAGMIFQF